MTDYSLRPVEETKQALVIPLIEKNRWRVPRPEELELADGQPEIKDDRSKPERKVAPTGDDITDQAVEELVQGKSDLMKQITTCMHRKSCDKGTLKK